MPNLKNTPKNIEDTIKNDEQSKKPKRRGNLLSLFCSEYVFRPPKDLQNMSRNFFSKKKDLEKWLWKSFRAIADFSGLPPSPAHWIPSVAPAFSAPLPPSPPTDSACLGDSVNSEHRWELGKTAMRLGTGLWEAERCAEKCWEGGSHRRNPISRRRRERAMAGESVEPILYSFFKVFFSKKIKERILEVIWRWKERTKKPSIQLK